eukprot:EG_transcript_15483
MSGNQAASKKSGSKKRVEKESAADALNGDAAEVPLLEKADSASLPPKAAKVLKKRKQQDIETVEEAAPEVPSAEGAEGAPPLKKGKKDKKAKAAKAAQEDGKPKGPPGGAPPEIASFKRRVDLNVSFKQIIKKIVKEVYSGVAQVNPSDMLRSSLMKFDSEAAAKAAIAKGWVEWNNLKVQCRRPAGNPAALPPHLREPQNALLKVGREEGQAPLLIAQAGWPRVQLAKVAKKNTLQIVFPTDKEAEEAVKAGQRLVYSDIIATPSAAQPPANQQKHEEKKKAKRQERQEKLAKAQKKAKVQRRKEKRQATKAEVEAEAVEDDE